MCGTVVYRHILMYVYSPTMTSRRFDFKHMRYPVGVKLVRIQKCTMLPFTDRSPSSPHVKKLCRPLLANSQRRGAGYDPPRSDSCAPPPLPPKTDVIAPVIPCTWARPRV